MTAPPLSIIVATRNESRQMAECLRAISGFSHTIVVDSHSDDDTLSIAKTFDVETYQFDWNGAYPKKRQWILDNLPLPHDWVLFIDADERLPQKLKTEIQALLASHPDKNGYFIRSSYKIGNKVCRFGMQNNKLVLFDRHKMHFPVIDDLACHGMGEIEGHYQPVSRDPYTKAKTGQLKTPMIHLMPDDTRTWERKHLRYARWAACMNARHSWPKDPSLRREQLKNVLRCIPFVPQIIFLHSFLLRLGCLDGGAGWKLARSRQRYYQMIKKAELARR